MTHYFIYDRVPDALKKEGLFHFALGDALIREVNVHPDRTMLHFWPIEKMVILGMVDTRLPYLSEGVQTLKEAGYELVVRPAGGLAVVADPGILNFSLILAEPENEKMSIDAGYEIMVDLIRRAFASYGKEISAYEITDSYCPGKFDLSIDGKKFAGIAQRRFKKGIGVMIYLSVNGDQAKRGEAIRQFYEEGLRGEETRWTYPTVEPDSMANLSDLLGVELTVEDVQSLIIQTAAQGRDVSLEAGDYSPTLMAQYHLVYEKIQKRNDQTFSKE